MTELITIANTAGQKLRILAKHEAEHVRLGWKRIADEPTDTDEPIDLDQIDIEKATVKELRALLESMNVEIPAGAKVAELRDLALAAKTDPNFGSDE